MQVDFKMLVRGAYGKYDVNPHLFVSCLPSYFWTCHDDHVCLLEQYPTFDWCVHIHIFFGRGLTLSTSSSRICKYIRSILFLHMCNISVVDTFTHVFYD